MWIKVKCKPFWSSTSSATSASNSSLSHLCSSAEGACVTSFLPSCLILGDNACLFSLILFVCAFLLATALVSAMVFLLLSETRTWSLATGVATDGGLKFIRHLELPGVFFPWIFFVFTPSTSQWYYFGYYLIHIKHLNTTIRYWMTNQLKINLIERERERKNCMTQHIFHD